MSRQNKVNPDRYKTAGRLSPDELARERQAQQSSTPVDRTRRADEQPPWMTPDRGAEPAQEAEPAPDQKGEGPADEDRGPD